MERENLELINELNYWKQIIINDDLLLEYAFFRVYIKFEVLFISLFYSYSVGRSSSSGHSPERKLKFQDEKHLKDTINVRYLGFDEKSRLKELISNVFISDSVLENFFNSIHYDFFQKMMVLRNYIAHESLESRNKYIQTCLNNKAYITPKEYLKSKVSKKIPTSNIDYFFNFAESQSNYLIDGND